MKKYNKPILNIGDDESFSFEYSKYFSIFEIFYLLKIYLISKSLSKRLNLRLNLYFDILDMKNTAMRITFNITKPSLIPIRRIHTFIKFLIHPTDRPKFLDSIIN